MENSPWPVFTCIFVFNMIVGTSCWLSGQFGPLFLGAQCGGSFVGLLLSLGQWWRDVVRESTMQGSHTIQVTAGLRMGFIVFIISEVLFFFGFFFAFFSTALSPSPLCGGGWPPTGVEPVGFLGVPLGNTVLLLSSGVSVTWAHHSLLSSSKGEFARAITAAAVIALLFLSLQSVEYWEMSFTISDSVYGSLFFLMTGFHGIHVFVGSLFLLVSIRRAAMGHFSSFHHLGFEAAAWYWHFVDVVWLFLYVTVYWWGGI